MFERIKASFWLVVLVWTAAIGTTIMFVSGINRIGVQQEEYFHNQHKAWIYINPEHKDMPYDVWYSLYAMGMLPKKER